LIPTYAYLHTVHNRCTLYHTLSESICFCILHIQYVVIPSYLCQCACVCERVCVCAWRCSCQPHQHSLEFKKHAPSSTATSQSSIVISPLLHFCYLGRWRWSNPMPPGCQCQNVADLSRTQNLKVRVGERLHKMVRGCEGENLGSWT